MTSGSDGTVPVTVLLPVHNGGRFLLPAVESVLGQTHRDLELLVIDDGSTDGAVDGVARITDPRVRVLRQENQGLVASLNRGLAEARHELVARMDADDLCHPDRLLLQVDFLTTHPAVAAVGCCYEVVDEHGRAITDVHAAASGSYQRRRLYFRNLLPHAGMTFRRDVVLRAGGYRAVGPAEDYDLWTRLASTHTVAALPDRLLRYRETTTGISQQAAERQREAHRLVREQLHADRPLGDVGWRTVVQDGLAHVETYGATCPGAARTYVFDHTWLAVLSARRRNLRTCAALAIGVLVFVLRCPAGAGGLVQVLSRQRR